MNLTRLARLTLAGLVYIYAVRLIDTLAHGLFRPAALAGLVVGLNLLAGLAQLLFFITLGRRTDRTGPGAVVWAAVFASAVALVPKLAALGLVFQPAPLLGPIRRLVLIAPACPWLSALLLLIFCLVWRFAPGTASDQKLKTALTAGSVGWLTMTVVQTVVLISYLTAGRTGWAAGILSAGPILAVVASSVTLIGAGWFYLHFARGRDRAPEL